MLFCLDTKGFSDGENDGPVKDEKLAGPKDADVIWAFDMMEEVGTYPHNLANSSPVVWGDMIYVSTSNGHDESHVNVPSPRAPAIIALNKTTGKLVWEDNSVEDRILHGQWSTPTVATIGTDVQVISGQGDGWVRGYEAVTGKKLWEFDTNPKDSVWPRTRNEIIATPVVYKNRVYLANGQDPEHGEGVGHFYAIDPTKRGDITKTGLVFHFDKIRRSVSTAAIVDDLIYLPDFSGFFHCIDANTGQEYWVHDMTSAIWGSALVVDGKVYLGNEDGDIVILATGKEKKVLGTMNMGSAVYGTRGAREQRAVHHEQKSALQDFNAMTRVIPAAALIVALGAISSAQAPARTGAGTADAGSWPQFRGNARLTGVSTSAPPAQLKLLWKYEAGDSVDSSPAIVDGAVYFGSLTGDLTSLDLASGKVRWKYATGGSIGESSPAVAGGTVYIGDGNGVVHAVRAADGQKVWTFKTTRR